MRFADSVDATTMSVSPALYVVDGRRSLNAFGTFSRLGGASSNSGTLTGAVRLGTGRVSGDVEGNAGGSFHSDGERTGVVMGLARLNVAALSRGAWAGAGAGMTWDGIWRNVFQGDAGAWLVSQGRRTSLRVSPTVVDDTIRFADLLWTGGFTRARLSLDASFGFRGGDDLPSLPANRNTWGGLAAAYWLSPSIALVAGAGTYPVDFAQGFPGGRFASLSLRWRPALFLELPPAVPDPATTSMSALQVNRQSGSVYVVRIRAPSARSVELTGDITGWRPVAMSSDGSGWWTTSLSLASGTHEVNVRADGGAWGVPPGLTVLRDEFGGRVGLLVIPQ